MPVRRVVASGKWSSPSTWENGNIPQNGDDVQHGSAYTVILDTNTAQLNSYTLDGALLLQNTGGVTLQTASLSGRGVIDIDRLTNPQGATINPCYIIGLGSAPLALHSLSSFLYYYSQIFYQTMHATFWRTTDLNTIYPYFTAVSVDGNDLLLSLAAESNSAAQRFISANNNNTFYVLLPIGVSTSTQVTVYLKRALARLTGTTLRCFGQAQHANQLPTDGRRVPIIEHTVLAPIVLRNCVVPATTQLDGVILSDGCTDNGEYVNVLRAIVRAPIRFRGEFVICHWDVYNPAVGEFVAPQAYSATIFVWCGETHSS